MGQKAGKTARKSLEFFLSYAAEIAFHSAVGFKMNIFSALQRHRWLALAVVLALVGAGIFFATRPSGKPKVELIVPQVASIEESVTAQGKLEPKEYVDVGVQVSGQLKKLHVAIGDTVKKGDLIAEIDPTVYEAKVNADEAAIKTLQAQLAEQQANIVFAKQQLARNQRLIKAKAISQEALEDSQTTLKVTQARVGALEAQLEQSQSGLKGDQANLGYTKVYAPMDGTIVSQTTREGQTVNANQTAPVIVQVANLDVMTVRAQVAEADVSSLSPNMEVYFTTLGSDHRWRGQVRQVLPSPETVNDVVLYDALVDVDNKDRLLMTGMSTQMFFVIGRAENALTIPVTALGRRVASEDTDAGKAYQVTVKTGSKPERRVVHVGLQSRTLAEIKDGITGEDKIIPQRTDAGGGDNKGQGQPPRRQGFRGPPMGL